MDDITDPSPSLWGSVNSLSTAPGNLLPPGLSSVRTVLHFGSGRSSIPSTGEKKVPRATLQSGGLLTPVNPRCVVYCVHTFAYRSACLHIVCYNMMHQCERYT